MLNTWLKDSNWLLLPVNYFCSLITYSLVNLGYNIYLCRTQKGNLKTDDMNKTLQAALIILLTIVSISLVGGAAYTSYEREYGIEYDDEDNDDPIQPAICDTITVVREHILVHLNEFKGDEAEELHFSILRNGKFIQEKIINDPSSIVTKDSIHKVVDMPYDNFLTTDTIVVMTKNKLYYYISGFNYYSYIDEESNTSKCFFSDNIIVNNRKSRYYGASLFRDQGWKNPNNPPHRIFPYTNEFDRFEMKAEIDSDKAKSIFARKTKDYSTEASYIEDDDYIFIYRKDYDVPNTVIRVNATTGKLVEVD